MSYPIPESTGLVTLTAIALAIMSNALTRRFVNVKAERRMRQEINEYNKELRQAIMAKDKQKEERLRRKQPQIKQMQAKASVPRLKVTLITWVPFLALYYFVATLVGGFFTAVAVSPLPIPYIVNSDGSIPLFWWYFISSFAFNGFLSKLMGTSM